MADGVCRRCTPNGIRKPHHRLLDSILRAPSRPTNQQRQIKYSSCHITSQVISQGINLSTLSRTLWPPTRSLKIRQRDPIPLIMVKNQKQRDGETQAQTSKETATPAPVPAKAPIPPHLTKNSTIEQSGPDPSHSVNGGIGGQRGTGL